MLKNTYCTLRYLSVLFLLFLLQAGLIAAPVHAAAATVKVDRLYDVEEGSTVEVSISVQNPAAMAGYQFELVYDPQVAVAKSVAKGASLPGSDPIVNMSDAAAGKINVAWMDLTPVNANVELCRITFDVHTAGETDLVLKGLELVGFDGNLSSRSENGIISSLEAPEPEPEPEPAPDPDPDPAPAPQQFTITTPAALPHGHKGSSYAKSFAATGGTAPYSWEFESGELPQGMELDKTSGELKGTPEESGRHVFNIKVTDRENKSAEKQFTLWVSDGAPAGNDADTTDYSQYLTTDTVTFKDLAVSQGSMSVQLSPCKMPYTMVVSRGTGEVNLNFSLYASEHRLYINNRPHDASAGRRIALQSGTNDIYFRVVDGDKVSRQYNLTVFRIP